MAGSLPSVFIFCSVLQITTNSLSHSFHGMGVQEQLGWVSCSASSVSARLCSHLGLRPVHVVGSVRFCMVNRGSKTLRSVAIRLAVDLSKASRRLSPAFILPLQEGPGTPVKGLS